MSDIKNHVQITSDGTPQGTKVLLNGEEFKGLTEFGYDISADRMGQVTLRFYSSVEGDLRILGEHFVVTSVERIG